MDGRFRRTTGPVFTGVALLLLVSGAPFALGQSPAAPAPAPAVSPRPTGPPAGSPPPGSRCSGCGTAPEPVEYARPRGLDQDFRRHDARQLGRQSRGLEGGGRRHYRGDLAGAARGRDVHHLARWRAGGLRVEARDQGGLRHSQRHLLSRHRWPGSRACGRGRRRRSRCGRRQRRGSSSRCGPGGRRGHGPDSSAGSAGSAGGAV